MSLKVLVVDDDEVTRKLLQEVLEREGYLVQIAASAEDAVHLLRRESFPIVVSDIRMVDLDGMAVLRESKKSQNPSAVIMMTGFGSMEGAIEAIQQGAFDYVSKPFKMNELKAVVQKAAKHWESQKAQKEAPHTGQLGGNAKSLIGKSPQIVEVYKTLARAAMSNSTILVAGESGTGKELVARAIHDNSTRKMKRFVAVNCGALAETLLESELFGHIRGAFTGAVADKRGLFEEANGGTLFLDEIGDITPSLQVRLLRVLQESEIKPVGSSESRRVDVRLIAATHRDLEGLVRQGKFREDLYYRLKVISIELPPLRERMEDLPDLVEYFLARYSDKNSKRISHVSHEAMGMLRRYFWPGNIRELENSIERAVAMTCTHELFPEDFSAEIQKGHLLVGEGANGGAMNLPLGTSLEDMERTHISRILQDVNFNKSKASEILGIDRATLYRKAQKYGIDLQGK